MPLQADMCIAVVIIRACKVIIFSVIMLRATGGILFRMVQADGLVL